MGGVKITKERLVCGDRGDSRARQECTSTRKVLGNCGENYKGIALRGLIKLNLNNGCLKIKIVQYWELVNKNLAAIAFCRIDVKDK